MEGIKVSSTPIKDNSTKVMQRIFTVIFVVSMCIGFIAPLPPNDVTVLTELDFAYTPILIQIMSGLFYFVWAGLSVSFILIAFVLGVIRPKMVKIMNKIEEGQTE